MFNKKVQSLRNSAQNISDSVQNIRQQITGRITNTIRGRYSRVSTHKPIEQHEPAPAQSNEPHIHAVTDKIMPLLHLSATTIQRLKRAVRQRRRDTERRYQEQIIREFDKTMMRRRQEELQRNEDAMNELDQTLRQDTLQQLSATRIQTAIRNRNAPRQRQTTQQNAATTIQNAIRNHNAMNGTIQRAKEKEAVQQNDAAITIQNAFRTSKAHKETIARAKQKDRQNQINETLNNEMENLKKQDAASAIQKL
jgi:hypothetical protein